MHILYVGLTYKHTPVKLREKTSFFSQDLTGANVKLNETKSILENVILTTCNRTEIYAVVDQLHTGKYYIKRFLADFFELPMEMIEPYLEYKEEEEVLYHCYRLGCGLDSTVIGETQILGQLKTSFQVARESQTTGTIFNKLFNDVIAFSKKMHTDYKINDRSASLSQSAMQIAENELTDLSDKHLFVLGAGEMSELVIKNSENFNIGQISIFNRTVDKALKLQQYTDQPLQVFPLSDFYKKVPEADIVISAISVKDPFITKQDLVLSYANETVKALYIDLGVPRNINPHCRLIEGVTLYDMDQVNQLIQKHNAERAEILVIINQEVDIAVSEFKEWEKQLGIIPVIKRLREKTLEAEEAAMTSLMNKLPDLTTREVKIIRKHMKSIVNQSLRTPIKEIKELSIEENAAYDIQLIQRIFGVEENEEIEDCIKNENQSRNQRQQVGRDSNETSSRIYSE